MEILEYKQCKVRYVKPGQKTYRIDSAHYIDDNLITCRYVNNIDGINLKLMMDKAEYNLIKSNDIGKIDIWFHRLTMAIGILCRDLIGSAMTTHMRAIMNEPREHFKKGDV